MNKVDISILGIRAKVFFRILSINAWILVVVPNLKEEVYHQESWAKILVCTHSNSAADLYIKVEWQMFLLQFLLRIKIKIKQIRILNRLKLEKMHFLFFLITQKMIVMFFYEPMIL